jgi:predicted nucleic acid-binding Zn ribbon protein
MAKSKRDHLDRDALAAQKAGLSYGQYKAAHPTTYYPETAEPEEEETNERRCAICGQRFKPGAVNVKYCSPACKDVAKTQRASRYAHKRYERAKAEKPIEQRACAICGKMFPLTKSARKFCSELCQEKGRKLRQKEHDARRRARRKEEKQNV